MNLFELVFFISAIVCAVFGAIHFGQFGLVAGIGGGLVGLTVPFTLSQIVCWIDDYRFSRTREGQRRTLAEALFDEDHTEKWIASLRGRPLKGKDGSFILTICYGNTRPPRRAFYRFTGDSMVPEAISSEEAQEYIEVPHMR